jgi:hypothetical protein
VAGNISAGDREDTCALAAAGRPPPARQIVLCLAKRGAPTQSDLCAGAVVSPAIRGRPCQGVPCCSSRAAGGPFRVLRSRKLLLFQLECGRPILRPAAPLAKTRSIQTSHFAAPKIRDCNGNEGQRRRCAVGAPRFGNCCGQVAAANSICLLVRVAPPPVMNGVASYCPFILRHESASGSGSGSSPLRVERGCALMARIRDWRGAHSTSRASWRGFALAPPRAENTR